MEKRTRNIEPGTPRIKEKMSIVIDPKGPYLVYGNPPLKQHFFVLNEERIPWTYRSGQSFSTIKEPTALCRCGQSQNHPYCDGSHLAADWNPELTADNVPMLENAEEFEGPGLVVTDNEKYCAFARFCDAHGQVWNLVETSDNPEIRELTIHDAINCPAGRLKVWDKQEGKFIEPELEPSLGLLEDPQENCSGPIWVKGGIPIDSSDGTKYELRNRVTLCRCGASENKPFCDGSHASIRFQDGLDSQEMKE